MITFTPEEEDFGLVNTGEKFLVIISAESSNTEFPVTSISVTPSHVEPTGSVTITKGANTANVEGNYTLGLFPNYRAAWVNKGESSEFVVRGFPTAVVPPNKDLTQIHPDSRLTITVTYDVVAQSSLETANTTYTHTVVQTYDSARRFILDYLRDNA